METVELAKYFIKKSPHFYKDLELSDIDSKHEKILADSYKLVKDGSAFGKQSFRDWKGQGDMLVPVALSRTTIKRQGLVFSLLKYVYTKLFLRDIDRVGLANILDDISILELIDAKKLMLENPVDSTPGVTRSYQTLGTSVNLRWLHYIYMLKRILEMDVLGNNGVWVDVGSYYGGLQGLVRKYLPDSRIVMVDFHHQLCRSYIYLSQLFPNATHILPEQISNYKKLDDIPAGAFMYIPVSNYDLIADQTVDLVSNFFSLGEMRRDFFNIYWSSRLFKESKKVFLVNRFVSSPFFENTYDSDLSILDYSSPARRTEYFDVFPMHHYMLLKRILFGRNNFRNTSSSYFEMVTENRE